jgi:hypothetical protein
MSVSSLSYKNIPRYLSFVRGYPLYSSFRIRISTTIFLSDDNIYRYIPLVQGYPLYSSFRTIISTVIFLSYKDIPYILPFVRKYLPLIFIYIVVITNISPLLFRTINL